MQHWVAHGRAGSAWRQRRLLEPRRGQAAHGPVWTKRHVFQDSLDALWKFWALTVRYSEMPRQSEGAKGTCDSMVCAMVAATLLFEGCLPAQRERHVRNTVRQNQFCSPASSLAFFSSWYLRARSSSCVAETAGVVLTALCLPFM